MTWLEFLIVGDPGETQPSCGLVLLTLPCRSEPPGRTSFRELWSAYHEGADPSSRNLPSCWFPYSSTWAPHSPNSIFESRALLILKVHSDSSKECKVWSIYLEKLFQLFRPSDWQMLYWWEWLSSCQLPSSDYKQFALRVHNLWHKQCCLLWGKFMLCSWQESPSWHSEVWVWISLLAFQ